MLQSRDYPVLNNYRDMPGEMFRRIRRLSDSQTHSVFPGTGARELPLV